MTLDRVENQQYHRRRRRLEPENYFPRCGVGDENERIYLLSGLKIKARTVFFSTRHRQFSSSADYTHDNLQFRWERQRSIVSRQAGAKRFLVIVSNKAGNEII